MTTAASLRTAVDIGGTFTDLALHDEASGQVKFDKALSTPDALADGILECLGKAEAEPAAIRYFVHGSTVAINAVIQRRGARTALVTTAGFEDVYEIGRANRPDTFNLFFEKPAPLAPATLRFGVVERLGPKGQVLTPLDPASLAGVVRRLKRAKVEAVAVCLLHAYANPAHEQAVGAAIRTALPDAFVTLSSDILREYREYERTSTTVLNAFVGPQVARYLGDLEGRLRKRDFAGSFYLMQSNGGVMTAERARQAPVATMESGPAGGFIGAAAPGRTLGFENVIAFDMGGTTAKTCLVERGLPKMADQYFIGGYREGFPLRLPVVDIIEVGAGGGSIAWIDPGDALFNGLSERSVCPPWGLGGGTAGRSGEMFVKQGARPARQFHKVTGLKLKPGDEIVFRTGGGGGHGDALERAPARVLDDVLHGRVSVRQAREGYGVVLVRGGRAVDDAATARLRDELRRGRMGRAAE